MSENGLIYKKISAVMGDIGPISKDRQNAEQKFKFRGIEDLYNAAHPAMLKHGVFCAPSVLEYESTERPTRSGGIATRVIMRVAHRFFCEDGSHVEVVTTGEGIDHSDKAANKCLSAAFKYALMELFCVPMADIEDSDRTTPESGDPNAAPVKSAPVQFKRPDPGVAAGGEVAESKPTAKRKAASAKVEAPEPVAPTENSSEFIDKERQDYLRLRFKDALDPKYQAAPICEQLRKGWLKTEGFIGDDGEGTSTKIPKDRYADVFKKMIAWAKEQGHTPETSDKVPF